MIILILNYYLKYQHPRENLNILMPLPPPEKDMPRRREAPPKGQKDTPRRREAPPKNRHAKIVTLKKTSR